MKAFIWLLGIFAVLSGIVGLGVGMGTRADASGILAIGCSASVIAGVLFLILSARQSRIDKEEKEAQRHREQLDAAKRQ